MQDDTRTPQINVSKITGGAGIAGAMFAIISTVIFLIGIPLLRYFLPAAIVLGSAVAITIHFIRRETPGKPWIMRAQPEETPKSKEKRDSGPHALRVAPSGGTA